MKRLTGIVLSIFIFLAVMMSIGCVSLAEGVPAEIKTVRVRSVEEFLNAVGSDREIILERGNYDLSSCSSYGQNGNGSYFWRQVYDGYELVITDVENITVRADDATIETEPRYAYVLSFENCANVHLENLTIGHTKEPGSCVGGVVFLEESEDISMDDCDLFGCGVIGLDAHFCENILLHDCEIYSCSNSAATVYSSRNVKFDDCEIYSCEDKEYGYPSDLLMLESCNWVYIINCEIENNIPYRLLSTGYSKNVFFVGNEVKYNSCMQSMFSFGNYSPVIAGCEFKSNEMYAPWYDEGSVYAVDLSGKTLEESDLISQKEDGSLSKRLPEPGRDVRITVQKENGTVYASTVDEFLAAIAPDTTIVLTGAVYNLTDASDYGVLGGEFYSWDESYDGPELIIHGADGLSIISEDGDPYMHSIVSVPRYANVLSFENCSGIDLSGFTMGHTIQSGTCSGGVLHIQGCHDFNIDTCRMYGCGVFGIDSSESTDIMVKDCEIYDCTQAGVYMIWTDGVKFENVDIHDVPSPAMMFIECSDKLWNGQFISNGTYNVTREGKLEELMGW